MTTGTTINTTLNPRAAQVCEAHGLSLDSARYYVASEAPWSDGYLMLGFTDDPQKAIDVAATLTPVVPGETFSARVW